MNEPLSVKRELLAAEIMPQLRDPVRESAILDASLPDLITAVKAQGLEGLVAEQEAMANLFAGSIGLYKNPQSHRHVPTHAEDAAEVIVFASQLLRIVDRLKP
jgi:hypothetical protein